MQHFLWIKWPSCAISCFSCVHKIKLILSQVLRGSTVCRIGVPFFFFQYSKTIIQHGHFLGRCSSACWDLTWGPVRVWAGGWRGASSPPGWQGALVQRTEPLTARGTGLQGSRLTLKSLHILKCKGKRPVYMCLTCVSVKKLNSPKINTLSCCFISVKQVKILFFHQSSASGSRL